MEKFTAEDIRQIETHGLSLENVRQNLQTFAEGIAFTTLAAPATLENGIHELSAEEVRFYAEKYENQNPDIIKFVPASGAATRMFKDLQIYLSAEREQFEEIEKYSPVEKFFDEIREFPFYEKLISEAKKQYPNFDQFSNSDKKYFLLKTLLDEDKLNFCNLPKGLVPFHKYPEETRTAFAEHLFEAAMYGTKNGRAKLHFTVAEEHFEKFKTEFDQIGNQVEKHTETQFDLTFSFQQKNTDTLSVDMENRPFRDENGALCFRPAGHGALLKNLNQMPADIVFIKNIDNVSTQENFATIATYKKALAGILLEIQAETFQFLRDFEEFPNEKIPEKLLQNARLFLKEKLNVRTEPKSLSELIHLLNRPIRVCGMVKNSGAPGGGPFWIKDESGNLSLQIVETAQIDLETREQKEILEKATHFNPVDLVCGTKNYKGKKFDLSTFSNPKRGFITQKSANGKDLKALELPGLWNGGMEHWNTIFVEVPVETFIPVKTVLDLLRPEHRQKVQGSRFKV